MSGLLERLLSHAAAGPSSVTVTERAGRANTSTWHSARRLQSSSAAWQRGHSVGHPPGVAGSSRRQRRIYASGRATLITCQALQAVDYSFYQRMREGELTEDFLWETRLLPLLGYLGPSECVAVREALSLAYDAHGGQRRKSGEPFITHPVEVTRILAELRMDYESLVAGLLHDTVEDCGDVVGLDEIQFHFGSAVRRIVEGETKFSKLPTHHPEDRNTIGGRTAGASTLACSTPAAAYVEAASANGSSGVAVDPKAQDLQFLFLAMTEEVRIIVVKLADRLHNMRTMDAMPPAKQRRIAQETLQVFAPLARLLGLYSIKEELEELSFKFAMPQQYDAMRRSVARLWEAQRPVVEAARTELQEQLEHDQYLLARVESVRVDATRKSLYSTWRKLNEAKKSVKELGDIAQLRVVLVPRKDGGTAVALDYGSEKQLCYHVMGLVHTFWAPIPGSMKDYIATPKPNNYQSLHTTVVPTGLDLSAALQNGTVPLAVRKKSSVQLLFPIEVQIRTEAMNRLAENGIAIESWSCAADRSWRGNGGSASDEEPAAYGGTNDSDGTSSGVQGWMAAAEGSAGSSADEWDARRNGSINGSNGSGRGFPFNIGSLVASMAGGRLPSDNGAGPSSSGSNGAAPASSNGSAPHNGSSSSSGNGAYAASANGSSPATNGSAPRGGAAAADARGGNGSSSSNGSEAAGGAMPGEGAIDSQALSRRINWLKSIREWQSEFVGTLTASEFVECVTDDLLGQSVFVFTPSGEVVRLPKGATVIDFAYHIHTEMGNTMVAAKVNGKVVCADHELQNAEVVEVVRYRGPVNATIIKRHQQWLDSAQTKTARHKIAKFLRTHAALAVSKGMAAPGGSSLAQAGPQADETDVDARQVTWLVIQCDDRPGLLAEVANVIARHEHNITAYSGSADPEAGLFVMEYELEGRPSALSTLCEELSCIESVATWAAGCALPEQPRRSLLASS